MPLTQFMDERPTIIQGQSAVIVIIFWINKWRGRVIEIDNAAWESSCDYICTCASLTKTTRLLI